MNHRHDIVAAVDSGELNFNVFGFQHEHPGQTVSGCRTFQSLAARHTTACAFSVNVMAGATGKLGSAASRAHSGRRQISKKRHAFSLTRKATQSARHTGGE